MAGPFRSTLTPFSGDNSVTANYSPLVLGLLRVRSCLPGVLAMLLPASAEAPPFTPYDEARPVVEAMREALPEGLAGLSDDRLAPTWPAWVRERDRAVRDRLVRGEEDAVVNLLFFGTSFTKAPRLTTAAFGGTALARGEDAVAGRLRDLAAALVRPGGDDGSGSPARSSSGRARKRSSPTGPRSSPG